MNDDELDPEQDARIRALLAEVATTDETTLPPEVAARLDETLAGLVAERQETAEETNVIPLRRRWAPRAAAAAAAVIVVGAGGVAAANLGVFDGASKSASDSGAAGGQAESFAGSASNSPTPGKPQAPADAVALPRITSVTFDADVARLVQRQGLASTQRDDATNLRKAQEKDQSNGTVAGCTGPKADDGSPRETVLYDGTRAVLVVHPPKQGRQAVVAWTCAGDHVLARTSVPVGTRASGQHSPGDPGLGSPSPSP
jgi:hypothetical protein